MDKLKAACERQFHLTENGTNIRTEFVAGLTTFMTMAYILIVNPLILGVAGMDKGGVFTATVISSLIATLMMAFMANYPFALAPGMGINAFFAYTVVIGMGHTWQFALTAVLLEGIIFICLSFFKVREQIFESIPMNLKKAVSVGIGLFIALIGLENGGLIVTGKLAHVGSDIIPLPDGVIVNLNKLGQAAPMLTLIGLLVIGILLVFKVKGALLIGIFISTIIGIPLGLTHLPSSLSLASLPPSLAGVAFKFEWSHVFTFDMVIVLLSFLFVDMFDTIGTLVGVASKTNMLTKDGKLPKVKQALLADAIGTVTGACLGTSTVTTYVESSAGVATGGRTGLTSVFTSLFFFLALFFAPLFGIVPKEATAPVLILVGLFMMSPIKDIDLEDFSNAIPAFLTIIMMVFAYSISTGIFFGVIAYVLLKLLTGKGKEVTLTCYILAALFILKFVFLS